MTKDSVCPKCGGHGLIYSNSDSSAVEQCKACNGTGRIPTKADVCAWCGDGFNVACPIHSNGAPLPEAPTKKAQEPVTSTVSIASNWCKWCGDYVLAVCGHLQSPPEDTISNPKELYWCMAADCNCPCDNCKASKHSECTHEWPVSNPKVERNYKLIPFIPNHAHNKWSIDEELSAKGLEHPDGLDLNTMSLCNCDGFWHIGAPDRQPAVYLDTYVQQLQSEYAIKGYTNIIEQVKAHGLLQGHDLVIMIELIDQAISDERGKL